ncbi:ATPase domain protein, prokaryote domain protein [Candidatus Omnitrophus magneticus]|uniref:ATPase domain protein, prokaryote domain protein n=1 Tax=Candidatus Omnitrophus magneticus TaxID=1609969 RepID=A0A0F0CL15_9BACT|nr:ATPase domain protein, prokaryote domain protein [Candidatus Omnitrophus magneticus]
MKSKRYFNTTGFCMPERHYMIDPLRNQKIIFDLIDKTQYFTIHAPRQTGKTTLLHELAHRLNKEGNYISTVFSVENAGYKSIPLPEAMHAIIESLHRESRQFLPENELPPNPSSYEKSHNLLYMYLSDWSFKIKKPIVLLLDEIDSLYDDVLVSVLRQLRNGFQGRPKHFPSTIALVGLRDVRDYKLKIRPDEASLGSGSPFNIKAESILLGTFAKEDITELYAQHTNDTGQVFPKEIIDRIYELTGGQPWLVNAVANEIIEKILKSDDTKKITIAIVEEAKENIIKRRDTHLDSLIDKLKEPRVKNIISAIINGDTLVYDSFNDDLVYVLDLGIVAEKNNDIVFANEIYREIIPRVLNFSMQKNIREVGIISWYINPAGKLDMDKLLKAFQEFYRENSEMWLEKFDYKEAGPHLLLMAFLQRIINGGGKINREMAVGTGRTDLLIEFNDERFVLELKLKRLPSAKQKGLDQISRYLDTLGMTKGYLILFELKPSTVIPWETRVKWEDVSHQNKTITVVEM